MARKILTPNILEQLGTNETGLLVMSTPDEQDAQPDALGRVVEGVEAQIVDANGVLLPVGTVGQVRYRGAGFSTRYLDNPDADARAFRDGWFYPGDLAAIDAEGYFFHKGRTDDTINNEGAKFYPVEVEAVLLAHPDVAEAAVLGWPHARHGEVAVAFVVRKSNKLRDRELQLFCRERIAGYKRPAMIIFLPELPKNSMGKVAKSRLRARLES